MQKQVAVLSLGLASVFAVACHDTLQPHPDGIGRYDGASSSLTLASPVQRATPLAQDVSWSFSAGPGGALSTDAGTGLTIAIPAGALSSDVTITVTALAGSDVAYRFEPHGLLFARNATLTQDLTKTTVDLLSGLALSGAYFSTDTLELSPDGLALVTDVIGAVTNPLSRTASFPIQHFSGYILASGRTDSTSTDGGQ